MYNNYQYPIGMSGYQMSQQPQMDRLGQLQQFQQQLQQPWQLQNLQQSQQAFVIGGKIVDSVDAVKATDIPMTTQPYYFPKADGTEIFMKFWRNDGRTEIVTFKPVIMQNEGMANQDNKVATIETDELVAVFNSRFDELTTMIEKMSKPTSSKAKKEVLDNE